MSIVTAVVPCYNAAAFLSEALNSAKAQTVPVAEILVIDDGSQDDSPRIAREAGARVLFTGGPFGAATARNLGAREARTPYLAFLDADDCWLPAHCESLLGVFRTHPAAALAYGRIQRFGPEGDIPTTQHPYTIGPDSLPELLRDNPIAQSCTMVDREKFLEAGGYDQSFRYAEDFDLWLRLAERYALVGTEAVTCRYRVHGGQVSNKLIEMIRCGWKARLACRARLRERGKYLAVHEKNLVLALAQEVQNALVLADEDSLQLVLSLSHQLKGAAQLRRKIRRQLPLLPLRRLAQTIKTIGQPDGGSGA